MKLIVVYYHPLCFDLCKSFQKICDSVVLAINPQVVDNYGGFKEHVEAAKKNGVGWITLSAAIQNIKNRKCDLVGCDGVFDGDKLIMEACKDSGVPWFCIDGYPHNVDEPSNNILSFGHFLPQIQYKQKYPSEGHVKEVDWKNISENGQSEGKNIFVFYPELDYAKDFYKSRGFLRLKSSNGEFVSFIHRFEECNKWSYKTFERIKKEINVQNYGGLSQFDVLDKLDKSFGLLHMKHGDRPGISVFEALILNRPVFVTRSFISASFNQEVLIDEFNAIIADDVDELIARMKEAAEGFDLVDKNARDYIWMLTNFKRQQKKLERFFERCLK